MSLDDDRKLADSIARDLSDEIDDSILEGFQLTEPSIIDRIGSIGDEVLAGRIAAWDRLAERRRKRLETLIGKMSEASNTIHKNTKAAKANWVIASPALAKQLDPTGEFTEAVDADDLP